MADIYTTIVLIGVLVGLVAFGVHIAVALGISSVLGIYLVTGDVPITIDLLTSTSYEALREYVFAVVPLFILMGELISRSGAAHDLFDSINRGLRKLPNRMSLAVVIGNALFAFVTGVSVAAAAAFSRIAYPNMVRLGYRKGPSAGLICGTACLGMLIPPSVLLIVWGVTTDQSIGRLFFAALGPGILIAGLFFLFNIGAGLFTPSYVFEKGRAPTLEEDAKVLESSDASTARSRFWSSMGLAALVVISLGGIWLGFFTPTEGAGIGAILALIIALAKGVRMEGLIEAILHTARSSAPILVLLIMAQFYSRMLALTGIVGTVQNLFTGLDVDPLVIIALMIVIWFVLGMFIDSVSIILLTVPIFFPVAAALGFDVLVFAMVGILAIEAGLMTPPFGMLALAVKSSIDDDEVSLMDVYRYSVPYWIILGIGIIIIISFPAIVTFSQLII
jgi:tripartite ATP-independent transporter DctM subunit